MPPSDAWTTSDAGGAVLDPATGSDTAASAPGAATGERGRSRGMEISDWFIRFAPI